MQKGNPPNLKTDLRKLYLAKRAAISPGRRATAAAALIAPLQSQGRILSFFSIGSEVELAPLNRLLATEGRLILNRLEHGALIPYFVADLSRGLRLSPLAIPEPDPALCEKAALSEIDLILVPGLAFDKKGYRLGYGWGYYDRFLSTIGQIPTKGIGFIEQLSAELLPRDPWDLPVQELLLR